MILTYDTEKLSEADARELAVFEARRGHTCMHLSGGVPVEHAPALEREGERHFDNAREIEKEVANRPWVQRLRAQREKFEADRRECFDEFASLEPSTQSQISAAVIDRLVSRGFSNPTEGDVRGEIHAVWFNNRRDFSQVFFELVDLERDRADHRSR